MNPNQDKTYKHYKSPPTKFEKGTKLYVPGDTRLHTEESHPTMPSYEKLRQLYQSVNPEDTSKYLSLKAIEEEEFVTQMIRMQREKLEALKDEFKLKSALCESLEEENKNLKKMVENNGQYQELYQEVLVKLKQYELSADKARAEKQILEENNDKLHEQIAYWKRECEKVQQTSKDAIQDLADLRRTFAEKEKSYKEQLHSASTREQALKEEIKNMKQEIMKYENYTEHLKDQQMALEMELKKLSHNQAKLDKAERMVDDLRKELADQKKDFEIKYNKLIADYNQLEAECESQRNVILSQEDALKDLRLRIKEEENRNRGLREENALISQRVAKLVEEKQQVTDDYNALASKFRELEKDLKRYRKEKLELKKEVGKLIERDMNDKKFREELERYHLEMLSARNTEIQKLYETFESFFPEQHESGKKPKYSYDNRDPYNFRDSTPKTDISGNSDVNRFDKREIDVGRRLYKDENSKSASTSVSKKKATLIDPMN